jgi:hypothetical protein
VTEAKNQEVSRLVKRLVGEAPPFLRLSSRANPLFRILVYYAVISISLFHITTKKFSKYITNTTAIFKILILYHLWGVFQYTEILLGSLRQSVSWDSYHPSISMLKFIVNCLNHRLEIFQDMRQFLMCRETLISPFLFSFMISHARSQQTLALHWGTCDSQRQRELFGLTHCAHKSINTK